MTKNSGTSSNNKPSIKPSTANRPATDYSERRSINEGTKLVSQPSYAKPPRKE